MWREDERKGEANGAGGEDIWKWKNVSVEKEENGDVFGAWRLILFWIEKNVDKNCVCDKR